MKELIIIWMSWKVDGILKNVGLIIKGDMMDKFKNEIILSGKEVRELYDWMNSLEEEIIEIKNVRSEDVYLVNVDDVEELNFN